jgi:four helix bundle protein
VNYEDWLRDVPKVLKDDALWKVEAYRLAVFLVDLGWHDVTKLQKDRRTGRLASQLYDAIDSIGSNISEGFSRGSGRERARFYEFACGSAREARHHYHGARHLLGSDVTDHRLNLTTQLIRLTLTMIPDQRRSNIQLSVPRKSASRNHVIT